MSETEAASTWLTVSQAAAALEVSERTIRRRCESGKLTARLATTDNGKEWQIEAAAVEKITEAADAAATGLRTGAAIAAATISAGADILTEAAAIAADATDSEVRPPAAIAAANERTADARDELIIELREQTSYLRSQIEAQRLQIEAANRATNEAHAALREALKMSHRALNQSGPQVLAADENGPKLEEVGRDFKADESAQNGTPAQVLAAPENQNQSGPQVLAESEAQNANAAPECGEFEPTSARTGKVMGSATSGPQNGSTRNDKRPKLTAWQKIGARILGIRS